MHLEGRTVLITGAATGIGKAIALKFASHGANIVINYSKSEAEAEDVVARSLAPLQGSGLDTLILGCTHYPFYRNIFLQTEYEYLNYEYPHTNFETTRRSFDSFLAGGGFIQPLGDRFAFYLMALYNFSYQEQSLYSPYDSPIVIRAGVNIGALGL